jgi:hypothetical protein
MEGSRKICLLCTVMHTRPLSNGLHSIGAEFTCVLPTDGSKQSVDPKAVDRIRQSMLD